MFPFNLLRSRNRKNFSLLSSGLHGSTGVVQKDIHPLIGGRIRVNGSEWPAKALNGENIIAGEYVQIIRCQGITLFVQPLVFDLEDIR